MFLGHGSLPLCLHVLSTEPVLPALVEDQKAFGKWTVTHDPKSEGGGESAPWKWSSADPGRGGHGPGGNKQQYSGLWQSRGGEALQRTQSFPVSLLAVAVTPGG